MLIDDLKCASSQQPCKVGSDEASVLRAEVPAAAF